MEEHFLSVLNMSLTASYVILVVMLIRLLLKKAPKVISYALWGVVAFRLFIPISFESVLSLFPRNMNVVPIPYDIIDQQRPQIRSGFEMVDNSINPHLPPAAVEASVNPMQVYTAIGACIWILGILALLTYSVVSMLKLKKQLQCAQQIEPNVFEVRNLRTPFALGLIDPKIYLPAGLGDEEKNYILLHERIHIRRKDHLIKMCAFLILCMHWFNPLVWLSFVLMSTDMELSCDERVLKELNGDIKKPYASSLLSMAAGGYILNGSPLAFGEGNLRGRIKNILNYNRPRLWVIAIAVFVAAGAVIGLMSNPPTDSTSMQWAKSLRVEDVQSIELIVQPSTEQERYTKYDPDEFYEIVGLINQSHGRLVQYPEDIVGGSQCFFITMKNGEVHRFANNGNIYLMIDGDAYEAGRGWLGKWNFKAEDAVPEGFWDRVQPQSKSYGLMQLKYGEIQRAISPLPGDNAELVQDIIMDAMLKSAAWPGIDIDSLEECYLIRAIYPDGAISDYYTFLQDGKAVLQRGKDGFCSRIRDELYEQLAGIMDAGSILLEWEYIPNRSLFFPGMPLKFDMDYREVHVTASTGSLYLNDESRKPNYIECGKEMTYSRNQTVYWSPMGEDASVPSECELKFSIVFEDGRTKEGTIFIKQTETEGTDKVWRRKYAVWVENSHPDLIFSYLNENGGGCLIGRKSSAG